MDYDFGAVIKKIMPLVSSGDALTFFVIFRNNYGGWQVHFSDTSRGYANLMAANKEYDPYTVGYCGVSFQMDSSYQEVFHEVLCNRLFLEFNKRQLSGDYRDDMETKEAMAMHSFFEDRGSEFSKKITDYLTTVEKPLAELSEICPYKMATDNNEWKYNRDLATDAILCIENAVNARLQSQPVESRPEPQYIDGYEFNETQSVQIGKITVVLAESDNDASPFIVYNRESGEDYNLSAFPDYLSAIHEFTRRQTILVNTLDVEREARKQHGVDSIVLTAAHCLPKMNTSATLNTLRRSR